MSTTARLQRRLPTVAFVAAMVIVAALVTRTSQAAFTATTTNPGNSFSAGTIDLTDTLAGTAMFNVSGLEPGQTATGCIEVTYTGTIASPQAVKVYASTPGYTDVPGADPASVGLSTWLKVTIVEGDATSTCAGSVTGSTLVNASTVAAFSSASSAYASGVGGWVPAGSPETRAYAFTVELDANTPDTEQGAGTTGVGFVWEVQS